MNIKKILFSIFVIGTISSPSTAIAGGMSSKEAGDIAKFVVYIGAMGTGAVVGGTIGAVTGGVAAAYKAYLVACANIDNESAYATYGLAIVCGAAAGGLTGGAAGCATGVVIGAAIAETICK